METSTVQSIKLYIVNALSLSKDALHIYVGLIVFLVVVLVFRRSLGSLWPWLAVLLAAATGEALDAWDDIASLGHWRWKASVHDVLNTIFWPTVLWILARARLLSVTPRDNN